MKIINLIECYFPGKNVVNDNSAGDYRIYMGIAKWVEQECKNAESNKSNYFRYLTEVPKTPYNKCCMIVEHIKLNPRCRIFDLANYERTVKPVIDHLASMGYIVDDNSKIVNGVIFLGGKLDETTYPEMFKDLKPSISGIQHRNPIDSKDVDYFRLSLLLE